MKVLLFLLSIVATAAYASDCGQQLPIIQKPILFNAERIALTQQYRLQHYGINSKSIKIIPKMIVLHWTTVGNLKDSFATFYPPTISHRPDIAYASKLNVSAHFLVDRNGTIYQLMPENVMARHVIGLDNIAIGIENVGGVNNHADLTQQQVAANVYLICVLKHRFPTIKYVIGHYEYLKFRNTPLWLEKNPNYFTIKYDPGKKFMAAVRAALNGRR